MKKVIIIHSYVPQYSAPVFERLRSSLAANNIELSLVCGQGSPSSREKKDAANLPWAIPSKNIYLFGELIVIQPCLSQALSADLVIVQQANKLILNYILQLLRPFVRMKLGFWGHGYCHQQKPRSFSNQFKSIIIKHVDWWFAYTNKVAGYVAAQGFPRERITVAQNAIDTSSLARMAGQVKDEEIVQLRKKMNITKGKTGVFCGGMYKEKQIPFLIKCSEELHRQDPEFSLILIGSGVDAHFAEKSGEMHSWIHYTGPQFGIEKVKFMLAADFMLLPGAVGLGILDSFVLERPLVTTDSLGHGPEIDYLDNKKNGIITSFTPELYIQAVMSIMNDSAFLDKLRNGCREAGKRYTVEAMVENLMNGIMNCLQLDKSK